MKMLNKVMKKREVLVICFVVFFLLIIISSLQVVSAELLVSDVGVEYESDILDVLDSSEWVGVIVNIPFSNLSLLNSILSNLTDSEFKLKKILLGDDAFAGNITREGFNKLINNSNIRTIYLNRIAHVIGNGAIEDKKERSCEEDSDCEIVSLTCCGCHLASINTPIEDLWISINKNSVEQWNKNLEENCQGTSCILGGNEEQGKRCNSYQSKCLNNQCEVVKILGDNEENQTEETNGETQIEEKSNLLLLWSTLGIIVVVILYFIIKISKNR